MIRLFVLFSALVLGLAAALFSAGARAASLVADVSPDADSCFLTGLPAPVVLDVQETAGKCTWDLTALPPGNYTVTATARNVWEVTLPSAPFAFRRPPSISIPDGLRLVP